MRTNVYAVLIVAAMIGVLVFCLAGLWGQAMDTINTSVQSSQVVNR